MNLDEYRDKKRKEIKDAEDLQKSERINEQLKREKYNESMKEIQFQINTLIYKLDQKDFIIVETIPENVFNIILKIDENNSEYYELQFIPATDDDGEVKSILIQLKSNLKGKEMLKHAKRDEFLKLENLDYILGDLVSSLNED